MVSRANITSGMIQRTPTHPGAVLREDVLPSLDLSVAAFARALGVSRQTVHELLAERKGVTPIMALKLGKVLGNGPTVWLGMQVKHDLYMAEQDHSDEIDDLPALYA